MSRDVETLRGGFDALWRQGDWSVFEVVPEDFEWKIHGGLEHSSGTGPESFERVFRDWVEVWENLAKTAGGP